MKCMKWHTVGFIALSIGFDSSAAEFMAGFMMTPNKK